MSHEAIRQGAQALLNEYERASPAKPDVHVLSQILAAMQSGFAKVAIAAGANPGKPASGVTSVSSPLPGAPEHPVGDQAPAATDAQAAETVTEKAEHMIEQGLDMLKTVMNG